MARKIEKGEKFSMNFSIGRLSRKRVTLAKSKDFNWLIVPKRSHPAKITFSRGFAYMFLVISRNFQKFPEIANGAVHETNISLGSGSFHFSASLIGWNF